MPFRRQWGPECAYAGPTATHEPECLRTRARAPQEKGEAVNYGRRGRQATEEMWQRVSLSTDLDCSKWRSRERRCPPLHFHAGARTTRTHQRPAQRARRSLRTRQRRWRRRRRRRRRLSVVTVVTARDEPGLERASRDRRIYSVRRGDTWSSILTRDLKYEGKKKDDDRVARYDFPLPRGRAHTPLAPSPGVLELK